MIPYKGEKQLDRGSQTCPLPDPACEYAEEGCTGNCLALCHVLCLEERRFGVQKILEVRGDNEIGDMSVRTRKTPSVNKDATTIMNLISWDKKEVYEPVMTCSLSKQELVNILDNPMKVDYLPCHGQAIERVVKQVTKASAAVYGEERQDGFIRASAAQRKLVPMRSSKQDLKKMAE